MLEESRFENILASLRTRRGWTQEDAAVHIGISRHTYSDLETGKLPPSPKHLKLIAAGFKLNQADTDTLYHAAHHGSPKIHNLPFDRNPLFTGRVAQLERLDQYLRESGRLALTQPVSISGLGGIGKTQLALEYDYRHHPDLYHAVFWVNADSKEALEAGYKAIALKLELLERDEQEMYKCVQAVKEWLEKHTHWLLIMDNADNLQLARDFFPKVHKGHILLTTRSQIVGDVVATQIEIDKMEPEEGLSFLLRRTRMLEGDATPDTIATNIRKPAEQLVELLGGHPLALDQAGAYIEDDPLVSFTDYINLYHEIRRDLLSERGSMDSDNVGKYSYHPDTVVVTFRLCFKMARKRHPMATDILHFCAFLQPDAIPAELFQHDNNFKFNRTAFKDGMIALRRYSLIKRNIQDNIISMHQIFSIHRLVQAVLIDTMSPNLQIQWRERVLHAVEAAFPSEVISLFENWRRCERLLPHALVCATWSEDELATTVGAARLFHKTGIYLTERAQYPEAETFLTRVLPIYEQHFGVESHRTAEALNDLANLYYYQGRYEQALPLFQQAFAIKRKLKGIVNSDTAAAMHNLAAIYIEQGKYKQAEPLLVRVCTIQESIVGVEHPETARSQSLLAGIYFRQGKYEQAESLCRQALATLENSLGTEHPETASLLLLLARILQTQGQYEQSEVLYQRALSIREQLLGAMHPDTKLSKRAYDLFLQSFEHDEEAAALEVDDEPSV